MDEKFWETAKKGMKIYISGNEKGYDEGMAMD